LKHETATVQVTDATFESEIERHDGIALVDFWAAWCGPWLAVAPVVDQLAREWQGRVKVAKLDVDQNPATTARFGIRSIPAILLFQNGRHVDTVIGADPRLPAMLQDKVKRLGAGV
jgi:thioredoxin 1